jgi:hypothetical protein
MPETLKKLREPAAFAAVVYAGVVILVGIINLLAPPGTGGSSVPFSDRAFEQSTVFLDLDIAASIAFAVYLANHVAPALAKARQITLAALVEAGLAALFGVVTALAQFGASGVDGESKLLKFLSAAGGAAVVAVAGLFVWLTWQTFAPARPAQGQGGAFVGGNWPGNPGAGGPGSGAGVGQQYGQPAPPPGGFGWSPQQGTQPVGGQPMPPAFGQHPNPQPGQQPGQPGGYGQPPQGAPQPFGADRTQMLPPVQSGQPMFGQQPGQQSGHQPGQARGQSPALSGSGSQQTQPPLPPTMQGYAAQPSPWSPGGPGGGQHAGMHQQPGQPPLPPPQGAPQPGQQIPPQARTEDQDQPQHPGPFQIGDWRSE